VGAGAAQCSRWLAGQGALPVAFDLSYAQLAHAQRLDAAAGSRLPLAQADACALPFASCSFDLACSAYGAVPFVADAGAVHREVARVLRPGGRWVFSVTHPVRWAFPDVPGRAGLRVDRSYFDRLPYVEADVDGAVAYVEHHRTIGDQVRALTAAGFRVVDIVEPEWPAGHSLVWGGWSPLRGALIPGTAIYAAELASSSSPAAGPA
jgi:SAM-dependent methyltransferase